jgi:hypothetical protein
VLGGTALHLETSGAGRAGRSQPQDVCHGPALKMAMVKLDGLYPPLVRYGSAGSPCMTALFHSSVHVIVGDGKETLFQNDRWIDG